MRLFTFLAAGQYSNRNNNECRARRAKRQAPTLSGAWPTLVTMLTLQGAQPGEQLFAAQGLLYRLRRFDLADALDLEDPAAQLVRFVH